MIRILFVILCLAVQPAFSTDIAPEMARYMKLARLLRKDPRNSPNKEEARIRELTRKIFSRVPNFRGGERLESIVACFASQALGFEISETQIFDSRKTSLLGHSSDKVFFVKSNQGYLSYVVKAFASPDLPEGKFLPELSGFDFLRDCYWQHVETVEPLAIGKCVCGQIQYGLILETAAPGKRCDRVLIACKQDHRQNFEKAERMFSKLGTALAELHGNQDPGYAHGDAHLRNMFYDEERQKIVLIDLHRLHHSVDILGQPLSKCHNDVLRLKLSLRQCSEGILSEKEIVNLFKIFNERYR